MQASAESIWGAAQQSLRTMLNTDIYNLWFLPIKAVALEEESLTLEVANDFCEVWLKDNYLGLIHDVLAAGLRPEFEGQIPRQPCRRQPQRHGGRQGQSQGGCRTR